MQTPSAFSGYARTHARTHTHTCMHARIGMLYATLTMGAPIKRHSLILFLLIVWNALAWHKTSDRSRLPPCFRG
jgi:hypothetical protein